MLYFYLFNIFIVYHKAGFTFFSKRHDFLLKEGANMSVCHLTDLKATKKNLILVESKPSLLLCEGF